MFCVVFGLFMLFIVEIRNKEIPIAIIFVFHFCKSNNGIGSSLTAKWSQHNFYIDGWKTGRILPFAMQITGVYADSLLVCKLMTAFKSSLSCHSITIFGVCAFLLMYYTFYSSM